MTKYTNRLICFLDVLGFKALMQEKGIDAIYELYVSFIDETKNKTFYGTEGDNTGRTNFKISEIVSDSMLFISHEINDIYNINNFIGAISHIMELGLIHNFPLRGAISFGDIIYDIQRKIFLSNEYNQITEYEPKMEMPQCVIFDEAKEVILEGIFGRKVLLKGINPKGNLPIIKYSIPLKEKKVDYKWCINYTFFLTRKQIQTASNYLISPKKEHFIKYINFVNKIPYELQVVDKEFSPAKYMKTMTTRSGMRMVFLDENMNGCVPNIKEFTWIAVGRWKE